MKTSFESFKRGFFSKFGKLFFPTNFIKLGLRSSPVRALNITVGILFCNGGIFNKEDNIR